MRSPAFVCQGLICLVAAQALAEAGDPPPVESEPDEQIVITAMRAPLPLAQIGSSVSVISAEDIARHQDRLAIDALKRVPGVTVRTDGNRPGARSSIFIRGADSDQTLVLVNGVRLHDPSAPNRTAFLEHMTTEDIERIEVLRGPQSTLYGSEAIGGVINIVTKEGGEDLRFGGSFEGGSYSTFTESVSARGAVGPVAFSLSGTRIDSKGISAVRGDSERDGYTDSNVALRLSATPNEIFGADVYLQYIASEIEIDAGSDFSKSDTEAEQIIMSAEPRLSLFEGRWEQKLRYWLNDSDRDNDGTGFSLPSDFSSFLYGFDWQNEITIYDDLKSVVGIEYQAEKATFDPAFASKSRSRTHNVAYYLDNQLSLWDRLFLTGGVRLDDEARFGTKATYRFTAALAIDEIGTLLRGSVGTGFKAPSLAQSFDASFGSNNPDLDPEESLGLDVGFDQRFFGDRLTLAASYFYNDIDDMIVSVPVAPSSFLFRNENVEDVKIQGVEASLAAMPHPMLRFSANYTYTDSEAKKAASFGLADGGRLLRRPTHEFNADLAGSFFDDRLQLTLHVLYVGKRDDLDPDSFATVEAGSYAVVDLIGSFRVNEYIELQARVENLADEDYEDVLGFNSPGISGFGGFRVRFP